MASIRPFDLFVFTLLTSGVFAALQISRKQRPATSMPPRRVRRIPVQTLAPSLDRNLWPRIGNWLAGHMGRTGWQISGTAALRLPASLAVVGIMVSVGLRLNVLWQVGLPLSILATTYMTYLAALRRRRTKFSRQFPTALELMARATRAGENLQSALRVAGRSSEAPLQTEFTHCVQQLQLGQSPARVMADLAARIGTLDVQLLAHSITMHDQIGGKLADALDRLSRIIRERHEFAERMRSTTGIARFAIAAILLIGIFVLAYLQTVEPDYLAKLSQSPLGRKMIAYGCVSELVGVVWVVLTLQSDT